jgi:outer membrane protein assembly factor BamB
MTFRTFTVGLLLAGLTAAAPASAAVSPTWDHAGYDAEDSYYNPAESVINAATIGALTRRWSVALRQDEGACGGPSAPLSAAGRVIATDQRGITAYQATTGRPAWSYNWDDPDDSTTPAMAVAGNTLIATNGGCQSASDPDGRLVALDLTTGRVRWQAQSEFPPHATTVDKGMVVVSGDSPSDELATIAYRVSDGKVAWQRPGYASSAPSADGRLLLTRGRTISAASITTGRLLWTRPTLGYAESATPAGDRFLLSSESALSAVDATTGAVAWTAPGKQGALLATDGRRVYRAAGNAVEALDARTGRREWARQLTSATTQPVRAGGLVYAGGPVLSAATGAILGTVKGTAVITGGRLLTVNGNTLSSYTP